jgi:cyanophycin synthetase
MVLDAPGAILEVAAPPKIKTKLRVLWRQQVRKLMARLGWSGEKVITVDHGKSQILAITAPIDSLLTATFVTEWAWDAALEKIGHDKGQFKAEAFEDICLNMLSKIASEANPKLNALYRAGKLMRVNTLLAEKDLSLGEGEHAKIYAFDDLPLPDEIAWRAKRRRIPIALVTGTNGKTTTVRALAHMLRTGGKSVGFCSTDFVQIGDEILQRDDYSGPTGARIVLRDTRVDAAVLEVARGGMLRRGLQVSDADVAIVTNVAADHLGENAIHNLAQLAVAKFTVLQGLRADAPLVVNADDPHCRALARTLSRPVFWFAMAKPSAAVLRGKATQAGCIYLHEHQISVEMGVQTFTLADVRETPLSLGGAAIFNIANLLAACAAALVLNVEPEIIRQSLLQFGASPADNPGRLNAFQVKQARVLVDYGHNTDGVSATLASALRLPHKRLLVGTGVPGDRSLETGREIARLIAQARPDKVIVKELAGYLRGRALGEMSGVIKTELRAAGVAAGKIGYADTDAQLVQQTLAWLKPGDLAMLYLHENVAELSALLLSK